MIPKYAGYFLRTVYQYRNLLLLSSLVRSPTNGNNLFRSTSSNNQHTNSQDQDGIQPINLDDLNMIQYELHENQKKINELQQSFEQYQKNAILHDLYYSLDTSNKKLTTDSNT